MKTVTSVSGGMTSAYLAANYPTDHMVFALVRIEDENCRFKDETFRKRVEDRIQKPFIATAEDDLIIYTIFDLEQYLGREIKWVSGITYDEVIKTKGGWLPNKLHRYCTTWMKIEPMFQWWSANFEQPISMNIGFRSNEAERANGMLAKTNNHGFIEHHTIVGKHSSGKNKWADVAWQKPEFPLIENGILKSHIVKYWQDKPVRFAPYNNCVGCFHRNPVFLRWMYQEHPDKMNWFENQEGGKNGYWMSINGKVLPYKKIRTMLKQQTLFETDFTSCDAGYCGM
jgi:hypothetical protein